MRLGIRDPLAHREQLDDVAGVASRVDRLAVDAGDALAVHRFEGHGRVERERREDGGLLRRVVAFDIGRRVGFGVTESLRVGEDVRELAALGVHAIEDVVRGAVDDAHDPLYAVAGQRIAQRADDRDGAGGGGLVIDGGAHLVGSVEDLGAVCGQQGFVRGDDIGARRQREQNVGARGLDAAHQLDDDVGADDQLFRIGGEQLARQIGVARSVGVAYGDPHELESRAGTVGELVRVRAQEVRHLGSDGSGSEQGHAQSTVVGHSFSSAGDVSADAGVATPRSRASRSSMLSPRTITRAVPPRTATTGGRGT